MAGALHRAGSMPRRYEAVCGPGGEPHESDARENEVASSRAPGWPVSGRRPFRRTTPGDREVREKSLEGRRSHDAATPLNPPASEEAWLPVPGRAAASVVVPAPASGEGNWAGAPSAALDATGAVVLAYRVRLADSRGVTNVVARSLDGESFTTLATIDRARFGAVSLERPSIVRTDADRWRLYVSCALAGKAWRIDMLEAEDPAALTKASPKTVFPGDPGTAMKDPVIRRAKNQWQAWVCCHPLSDPGEEDRMRTAYLTSDDGIRWDFLTTALGGRSGCWDSRGARVTSVLSNRWATYDGRASKEENFSERTGIARPTGQPGQLISVGEGPVSKVRYLDILELPDGRCRLFYEAPLADGSHELRTEVSDPVSRPSQD